MSLPHEVTVTSSRSGCGRYIATQWFWAALHLINLPPTSEGRPNPTNLVCSGYRTSAFATTWRMLRKRCPSMRECLHRGCVPILHECIPWPHRADVPPDLTFPVDLTVFPKTTRIHFGGWQNHDFNRDVSLYIRILHTPWPAGFVGFLSMCC